MPYPRGVRWERFFDDLEAQLESEWEAERAALDSESERLRLAGVSLRDRLAALMHRSGTDSVPVFDFLDGATVPAEVTGVGADWVALAPVGLVPGAVIAPLAGIRGIGVSQPDLLHTARARTTHSPLADRITFGYALRDLVRRRVAVTVHPVTGPALHGTIDRAGREHMDLALHDPERPRRTEEVSGYRIVPFAMIARVRVQGIAPRV